MDFLEDGSVGRGDGFFLVRLAELWVEMQCCVYLFN